ncbi:MAG TPA: hypothetical protein VFM18_19035 [Methanosarcina sp.]|nr:hypothetical protein [Methanosarcina sp.]
MTTPVTIGQLIRATDYSTLATQVNAELTRRGGGTPVTTSYSGQITAAHFNAINTTLQSAVTYPYNTGLTNLSVGSVITAANYNNLLNAINTAQGQIIHTQGAAYNIVMNNAYFTSLGWDGVSPLVAYLTINGIVGSTSTGSYALSLAGSYPTGSKIYIYNTSYIVGMGGNGCWGYVGPGTNGGPALQIASGTNATWYITNTGTIGGGGGGGAASAYSGYGYYSGAGAGQNPGAVGYPATLTTGGANTYYTAQGGGLGQPGGDAPYTGPYGPYSGGAAGAATSGAANAVWLNTGTRLGTIA